MEPFTTFILGIQTGFLAYLFVSLRRERKARISDLKRLSQHFYNHVEENKVWRRSHTEGDKTNTANIHHRINDLRDATK